MTSSVSSASEQPQQPDPQPRSRSVSVEEAPAPASRKKSVASSIAEDDGMVFRKQVTIVQGCAKV